MIWIRATAVPAVVVLTAMVLTALSLACRKGGSSRNLQTKRRLMKKTATSASASTVGEAAGAVGSVAPPSAGASHKSPSKPRTPTRTTAVAAEPFADPKILEEARQTLKSLQQLTGVTLWKSTVRDKEVARRSEAALKKETMLSQALVTMTSPVFEAATQVVNELTEESLRITLLQELFSKLRGEKSMTDFISSTDCKGSTLALAGSECVSSILIHIGDKLIEAYVVIHAICFCMIKHLTLNMLRVLFGVSVIVLWVCYAHFSIWHLPCTSYCKRHSIPCCIIIVS
jgi:hypothetical protein